MKRVWGLVLIAILAIAGFLIYRKAMQPLPSAELSSPPQLYQTYCMQCHGETGNGQGELAYVLYPKPRDFTRGIFKLRSTPSGSVPTDEDLARTIRTGMPGTAMPSFYFLGDDRVNLLVSYVKQLSQDCSQGEPCKKHFETPPQPVEMTEPLPASEELIAKGREVYTKVGCHTCHGEAGKGDGVSAAGLKDTWGYPIRVRDFTQGTYLGGGDPKDLYLRFTTGLDGTPMPSYGDTIQFLGATRQEGRELTWGLVYFVKSLETPDARARKSAPPADGVLTASKVEDSISVGDFLDVRNPVWASAVSASIPLNRLWQKDTANQISAQVKFLRNGQRLAVMMEWADRTEDGSSYRVQDFQDAAAVQFSLMETPGFHGMGQQNIPSNIWFWRSEWQRRMNHQQASDIQIAYGNRASDAAVDTYPQPIREVTWLAGAEANNPISAAKIMSPVEDLNAGGPGTLASQPGPEQNVQGSGLRDGDTWRVVFVRDLQSKDPGDVRFRSESSPVAFAVWNGDERDRNGQKFVSTWYTLKMTR